MHTCSSCGRRGSWPEITAQSEQRSADGQGWDALYGCADYRACEQRLLALDATDRETTQTVKPGSTTVHAA